MTKPFSLLRSKMSSDRRQENEKQAERLSKKMIIHGNVLNDDEEKVAAYIEVTDINELFHAGDDNFIFAYVQVEDDDFAATTIRKSEFEITDVNGSY